MAQLRRLGCRRRAPLSLIFNLYVVAAPTWLMSTFGCFPTV
jgi:hypothetical protein